LTEGGDGVSGYKHTENAKKLMSENHEYSYGIDHPLFGKPRTDEVKNKISETKISNSSSKGVNNPMFGKTGVLAPAFGRKGDKHPNVKLNDENLLKLREDLKSENFLLKELTTKYGVSMALISKIKNNKARN